MALPPGASSSTGLGAAAGGEALGEETHPLLSAHYRLLFGVMLFLWAVGYWDGDSWRIDG